MALRKPTRRWTPSTWASKVPFGVGQQRPNNYLEVVRAAAESSDRPGFAWRILNEGVCDGCALGTKGLEDWTIPGIHLCNVRLRLLRLNTMGPLDADLLRDVDALRSESGEQLRAHGRIPYPLLRRRGEPGFRRITWDTALDLAADRIREAGPRRIGFYLTSRGMPNENYYAAQKAARALGTNSIDNAARVCHSPSTVALKETTGVGATTCSYSDWIGTDLIVFIGSNVANNQPVTTKYLHYAKKAGTKVVVVNPYREPGMERYWVPSKLESALFGTKICDRLFQLNTGGDAAFLTGTLKRCSMQAASTMPLSPTTPSGFEELRAQLEGADWERLEALCGLPRAEMLEFARMLAEAERAVLVWSMGITQHVRGEDNVRAIVNLALARGFVGREGCGLMPIRGHSGVQGGAEMGCYTTALPGGCRSTRRTRPTLGGAWGFEVPTESGLTAPEMLDAAGGASSTSSSPSAATSSTCCPSPTASRPRSAHTHCASTWTSSLSSQMLVDPGEAVLLLPATTRYEVPGGVTETTTERRVDAQPRDPGTAHRRGPPGVGVSSTELAARVRPQLAERVRFDGTPEIREEISRIVPLYRGIEELEEGGESFQYGGPHLCAGGEFPTADGRPASASSTCRARRPPTTASSCPRGAASSSTAWSRPRRTH